MPKSAKVKFYAVKRGKLPGVYDTWEACKANVDGFSGAVYKSFNSREGALQFARVQASGPGSSVGAVAVKEVDKEAVKQTYGAPPPGATKVSSSSAPAALPTESTPQQEATTAADEQPDEETDEFGYTASDDEACATIDLSPSSTAPASSAMITTATLTTVITITSGTLTTTTLPPSSSSSLPPLTIFTDGSCLSNGTPSARAGIGIYFGPSDPRNTAARLPGTTQTNNRAELFAVIRALEIALENEPGRGVVVYSDSSYMKNGIETWVRGWMRRKWKTREGKDVLNKDLWVRLEELKGRFPPKGLVFKYVPAHVGIPGNEAADQLANRGAMMDVVP
ncbi:ribonuclease H-like domain-containing protein [Fimicolochytrium jonesii]|uniref:ribonuclease H-like domain-containing protein n=1 Tax=Fimicolochytrium jonesii TaxID=1396493 RepID=UPI0022FEACC1|nr:ribonuclease H-like domain-containing protein [Fimicolochytrium jonesii]KAI8824061.1 ribonuclease H-like domain-containing protein [Fimicolochytrium jonesii]